MDYGQTQKQPDLPQDFFTVGAGTNSEDLNDINPEDNLDLSNDQASWDPQFMQMPPDNITEPIRSIDASPSPSTIPIESPEPTKNTNKAPIEKAPSLESTSRTPELGKVTKLQPDNISTSPESDIKAEQYLGLSDLNLIKTTEKLSHQGIEAVDHAINKLGQDGDAASFYEMAREANRYNIKSLRGGNLPW